MCAGFLYIERNTDEFEEIAEEAVRSALTERFVEKLSKPVKYSGDIRPTDVVPVIAPDINGKRAVFPMKWGFTMQGSKQPLINARMETASVKPTFRESWSRRRCAVPAGYYYEWRHRILENGKTKTDGKYLINARNSTVTWLCGLYRIEDDLPVFTILTKAPGDAVSRIHDRMPLILPQDMISDWVDPNSTPEDLLSYALTDMVIKEA